MSKKQWLMIIGVLIIALPFLGFPSNWDTVFYVIFGIIIIAISYRFDSGRDMKGEKSSAKPYIEQRNDSVTINSDSEQKMNL